MTTTPGHGPIRYRLTSSAAPDAHICRKVITADQLVVYYTAEVAADHKLQDYHDEGR